MYIRKNPNSSGAYPAPQSNYAEGLLVISEEFLEVFFQYNGFVLIEHDGTQVTGISPKRKRGKMEGISSSRSRSRGGNRTGDVDALADAYREGVESVG